MIVNSSRIDSYREVMGDEWGSFVNKLFEIFKDTVPNYLSEMKAAFAVQDTERLKHIAHTLKSSASIIGADKMFLICAEIENMAKEGDLEGSRVMIAQLESILYIVFEEIESLWPVA